MKCVIILIFAWEYGSKLIDDKLTLLYHKPTHFDRGYVFLSFRSDGLLNVRSMEFGRVSSQFNRIVQSPHENYFNVCRQHKEK